MNKNLSSKTEFDEAYGFFARLPRVESCGKCAKTVFYRLWINGRRVLVHGDNSYCVEQLGKR